MIFDLDDDLMRAYESLPDTFMISDVFANLPKPDYIITNASTYTRVKRQLQRMAN
jgi:hypothetical protein